MSERFDTRRLLALRTLPIFRDVPAPVVAGAAKLMHEKKLARGEVIQEKDLVVPRIWILPPGKVTLDRDGKMLEINGPAYLGLYYALSGVVADARVTALSELKTFLLDAVDLFELFEDHFAVLRSTIKEVAKTAITEAGGKLVLPLSLAGDHALQLERKVRFDLVDKLFFLRRMFPLPHVSIDALASIARQLHPKTYAAGAPIWKRGDPAIDMTIILRGTVVATSDAEERIHEGGGPLGGLEVFAQAPRWFDLTAKTETLVMHTSYDAVLDMFEDHTDMGSDVVAALASTVLQIRRARGDIDLGQTRDSAEIPLAKQVKGAPVDTKNAHDPPPVPHVPPNQPDSSSD